MYDTHGYNEHNKQDPIALSSLFNEWNKDTH